MLFQVAHPGQPFCLTIPPLAYILVGFATSFVEQLGGREANSLTYDKVRLCFHDRCFDGTASAALFYRFYRERFDQARNSASPG